MKNKMYLFLLLCCMVNLAMANTDKHFPNEANPSFYTMTEATPSSIKEDFFTDPVINCPSNIVQTANAGQNAKTISWNVPTATTPCTVSTGQNCPSDNISGFIFIGKLGGSKYYCSDNSNYNYWEAKQKAEQSGGYLAVVCSAAENQFIRDGMSSVSNPADEAWIGLNDEANEGHFRWVNGSTCGYRNWAAGEPNDEHNNSNYHGGDNVILHRNSGEWKDRNGRAKYEFVMEVPCDESTRPGNVTVTQIAGPAPGSSFAAGSTTTIRYRATDECGRSKECSFTVRVNPAANPCANNGGDSDGDGVCDDQDNCDFNPNPNQADNDGDGIGNACDDTPNGNPCANNGGDSDGDGVCDDQDNCDFTANPDQADNDGDGIGNVCDSTPNGNGGGADCNDVTVTGESGKVKISSIPSGAKIEISGPSTGYGQQLVCEGGNCSSMEMVSGLSAGEYNVTIQTFNPYCYNRVTVTVTGGGGGSPCDGQGGDSDGDGICDNQDNCDFNPNPDQADNDGDGIGNVCDDTPNGGGNGGDCNSVSVTGESGKVKISSIPSGAKVEVSGPGTGYGQQLVCEGNCSSMEMVSGLSAGEYNVTIQTFNPYCYNRVTVTVTGGGGGSPCDNQGGDSDGDGICDNQDNCDFNPNPDQADNDGDGIGNACDDTPNGGGNGGDCNSVSVTGESGKVTISSIPSGAKVEISGPSTSYGQQLVCEGGNCSSMEMVSGLSAGEYNVTIQTFNPYCYNRVTVTVTGGGGGSPCDGQGGDSDGDGICDNQDNCDFNPNPDQADNDGDGIGNACDDTPNGGGNGGDCNSVSVTGESGKVTISSIPSGAKVEVSGPGTGYGQQLVCEGNCSSMEMVSGLSAGEYNVTIQTFNPYCYNRVTVTVTGGGGGSPCDNQGGDSDGDGICDNQDNCDFNPNPDQADNDGDGIGNACDDTPNGGGNGGDCNSVSVTGESGKVKVSSIPSGAKIEVSGPGTGYGQQLVCEGNCSSMEMVSGLSAGDYNVTIQTFNPYCYSRVTVTVTGGGNNNPCANQGGDSDGDGICDNQDNCDFTANPDQADNDGDGIGNACDDTPNGPCGNQGGDSDGDGICDNQDNCDFTANPDQADNDGDGIGNACDDTPNGPCGNQGGDSDGDGICDNQDNCDFTANPNQADNDGDGIGNACDDTPNGPCSNQGGDSDGDGICDNQDNCPNTSNANQADNDGDGIGNACDDTPNGEPTVCADRTVSNTNLCSGTHAGTRYGGYLLLDRIGDNHYISNNHYDFQNGKFVEFTDGTARLTGRWVNRGRSGVKFDVDIHFSGRTNNQPGKNHNCLNVDRSKFYFYTTTNGTLTGRDKMAGARLSVSRVSDAFQVGVGANITHNQKTFGASGWLNVNIESQPTTGINIYLGSGNSGQNGDININLSGSATACVGSGSRTANLTFTAFEAQRQVALQWATNSTYRNDYYVIEKSTDGENFEEMSKINNEVFGLNMESFTQLDLTPQLGENYYRLKEVYLDGSFEYTATELINFNIDLEALEVYPNPVNKELFINMKQFVGKQAHILLMNQYGQLIQEVTLDEINEAPVRMEVGNIPNGIYLLTIQPGGGLRSVTKKLVVGKMY